MAEFEINIPERSLPELLGSLKLEYAVLKSSLGLVRLAKNKILSEKLFKFIEESEFKLQKRIDDVANRISSCKVGDFVSKEPPFVDGWQICEYRMVDGYEDEDAALERGCERADLFKVKRCVVYRRHGVSVTWFEDGPDLKPAPGNLIEDIQYAEKIKIDPVINQIVKRLIDPTQGLN